MSIRIRNLIFALFLALCTFALSQTAPAQGTTNTIIDVHTHLVPGAGLRFEKALAAAVKVMDRYNVGTSILMSPPRTRGIRQNYDAGDFRAALEKYPGRFIYLGGGGSLNPTLHAYSNPLKVTQKVRRAFAAQAGRLLDQGAVGFGEIGGLHISLSRRHGYTHVAADHPLLKVLADVAAERGVPVDLHMDVVETEMKTPPELAGFPNNPAKLPSTLGGLDRLLAHNPNAKIVWAHGGTDHLGDFSAQTIDRLMKVHSNLYVSLKVSGPAAQTRNKLFLPGALDPAWRSLLLRYPNRFVIGTDNFYADPKGSGPTMEFSGRTQPRLKATVIFLSLLPAGLARKIGRDNALRLYRLTPAQAPSGIPGSPAAEPAPKIGKGLCRDGNMAHCRTACKKGVRRACARLKKGG